MSEPSSVSAADAAFEQMAWTDAYEQYMAADLVAPLAPGELERAASAAHLTGRDLEGDALWQRTVQAYEESGEAERAALAAWRYAMSLMHAATWRRPGVGSRVRHDSSKGSTPRCTAIWRSRWRWAPCTRVTRRPRTPSFASCSRPGRGSVTSTSARSAGSGWDDPSCISATKTPGLALLDDAMATRDGR